uniref:Uncharacterized protein n=1 Tax=Amphimedon queenslandica TaxID=400682 RepID=A0A1X7UG93_AMPQE
MAEPVPGVCVACKEDTIVYNVVLFECMESHLLCDSCMNSSELKGCPIHKFSKRRTSPNS